MRECSFFFFGVFSRKDSQIRAGTTANSVAGSEPPEFQAQVPGQVPEEVPGKLRRRF